MNDLSSVGNDRIAMGGNHPPYVAAFSTIQSLYDEAANWASDGFVIASQEQADQVDVLDKALLKAAQDAEALRVEEKRPLDEMIDEIQARYNPYIQKGKGKVDIARSSLKTLLTAWRNEQERVKREAAEKARLAAEEERQRAEDAMRSSAGDLAAREQAEQLLDSAKQAERFAKKADKAATTGLGLRTTYRAALADPSAAIRHYWQAKQPEFIELVQRLADQDVRSGKREIPGFNVIEEKVSI